jgi:hypothetical protein
MQERIFFKRKKLKIIPIAKPGRDIYDISSYRPIFLIPVLAKLASSLVKDRLTRTIKRLKLIPAMSMGFKKGEAATTCVNYILNQTSHNTREGNTTVIGFLDLSAAFDNEHHQTTPNTTGYENRGREMCLEPQLFGGHDTDDTNKHF